MAMGVACFFGSRCALTGLYYYYPGFSRPYFLTLAGQQAHSSLAGSESGWHQHLGTSQVPLPTWATAGTRAGAAEVVAMVLVVKRNVEIHFFSLTPGTLFGGR